MARLVWNSIAGALIAGVFLAMPAPEVEAQVVDGAWIGINAGAGFAKVSCSDSEFCEDGFGSGMSWGLQGGGPLSRSVHWSVEGSGYYSPDEGGDPWLLAISALARWSPAERSGFFLKGGGGWSWFKGLVPAGESPPSGNAFEIEVGTGWDFATGQGLVLSPYLDLIMSPSATIATGEGTTIDGAKIYVIQLGLSIIRP